MVTCRSLPPDIYQNRTLCEWYVQKTGKPPQTLDTGETYVDLRNSTHPRIRKKKPDEKISPRELHTGVVDLLEDEWKKFLVKREAQPLAEELYDRFQFLPPWLPKPLSRMTSEEEKLFDRFLSETSIHHLLKYDEDEGVAEDKFLDVLAAGVTGCVGLNNLFYFRKKIVERKNVQFIEIYRHSDGQQQDHFTVRVEGEAYDPSYQFPVSPDQQWFLLHPMDHWALSLMNAGIAEMESGKSSARRVIEQFGQRAYQLAPDYFFVRFNLGVIYYQDGQHDLGLRFLRGAAQLYPDYEPIKRLGAVIHSE